MICDISVPLTCIIRWLCMISYMNEHIHFHVNNGSCCNIFFRLQRRKKLLKRSLFLKWRVKLDKNSSKVFRGMMLVFLIALIFLSFCIFYLWFLCLVCSWKLLLIMRWLLLKKNGKLFWMTLKPKVPTYWFDFIFGFQYIFWFVTFAFWFVLLSIFVNINTC